MNKNELREELVNLLQGMPRAPRYQVPDVVDALISGISDDLCRRLTASVMVMQGQMVNLANANDGRLERAKQEGVLKERERCMEIMINKFKWPKRRVRTHFVPKED